MVLLILLCSIFVSDCFSPVHGASRYTYLANEDGVELPFSSRHHAEMNLIQYAIEEENIIEESTIAETIHSPSNITYGGTIYNTLKFYLPNIISQTAQISNNVWVSHLFGKLGGEILSSEATTAAWQSLTTGVATSGLRATAIIAGQLNSKNDLESFATIGNVNKSALITIALYSLLTLPVSLNAENIIRSIGIIKDPTILRHTQDYFNGFVWGAPAMLLLFNDVQFSLAVGDIYAPLIYCFYTGVGSFLADSFAFGKWGFPELGVEGIGYARTIGAWSAWIMLRLYYVYNQKYAAYDLHNFYSVSRKSLNKYMTYSVPLGASSLVDGVGYFLYSQFVTRAGNDVAQAYSSASAYFGMCNGLLGFIPSISALIANKDPRNLPKDELTQQTSIKNLYRLVNSTSTMMVGLSAFLSAPALIWQNDTITFFGGNNLSDKAEKLAKIYLWYNFGLVLSSSYCNVLIASLHGLKDVAAPFGINLALTSTCLTVAILAAYSSNLDSNLLIAAPLLANGIGAILFTIRWNQISKNLNRTITTHTHSKCEQIWTALRLRLETDTSLEEDFK